MDGDIENSRPHTFHRVELCFGQTGMERCRTSSIDVV
jgi:hypothetical protein